MIFVEHFSNCIRNVLNFDNFEVPITKEGTYLKNQNNVFGTIT